MDDEIVSHSLPQSEERVKGNMTLARCDMTHIFAHVHMLCLEPSG